MSPNSAFFALGIVLLAMGVIQAMSRVFGIETSKGHFEAIDGLRGYMAFFVFLHHSCVWYFFLHTGSWDWPPSHLYNHFGPTSVAFFFMITAYLFFSKLIEARKESFDWVRLYVGRIMRIVPLYLFAVFVLWLIAAALSNFRMKESPYKLVKELFEWLIFARSNINGLGNTRIITAGVTWSLTFEWLFYCSLALIGRFLFRIKTPNAIVIASILGSVGFAFIIQQYYPVDIWHRSSPFLAGVAAAFMSRSAAVRRIARSKGISVLIFALLIATVYYYVSAYGIIPYLMMSICFIAIACGNTLFGILTFSSARLLGQISYSIYLLHGMFLTVVFRYVIGLQEAAAMPAWAYWILIAGSSIFLLGICCATYTFIEAPGMRAAGGLRERIRRVRKRKKAPAAAT